MSNRHEINVIELSNCIFFIGDISWIDKHQNCVYLKNGACIKYKSDEFETIKQKLDEFMVWMWNI